MRDKASMKNQLDLYKHNKIYSDVWHYKLSEECVKKEDCFLLDSFMECYYEPAPLWENKISTIEKENLFQAIYISRETNPVTEKHDSVSHFVPTKLFIGNYDDEKFKSKIEEFIISKGLKNLRMEISDNFHIHERYKYEIKHIEFYRHEPHLVVYYSREGLLRGAIRHDYFDRETGENYLGKKEDFERLYKFINRNFIKDFYGKEALHLLLEYYQKNFLDNFEYGQSFLEVFVSDSH